MSHPTDQSPEEALRQSEARFAKAFQSNPAAMCVTTIREGRFIEVNDRYCQVLGYAREELVGQTSVAMALWADPPARSSLVARVQSEGFVREVEAQFRGKSGKILHVLISMEVIDYSGEAEPVLFSMFIDITERIRAAQANERALQRLYEAQRIGQIGDWEFDFATQEITWSPQVYEILGRDPRQGPPVGIEEAAGMYEPASRELLLERVARAVATGEPQAYQLSAVKADGGRVYVQAMALPRKDKHGKVFALYGTVQNITARKLGEEALCKSEERLRLVTENARVGLVMVNRERRYTFANAAYAEILGFSPGDLVGRHVADVLGQVYETQVRPRLDRAFAGERVFYDLHRPGCADERYYAVRYEPTIVDGEAASVVVVLTDITERKQAEAALGETKALREAILTSASYSIIAVDTELRIHTFNRAAEQMLGYTAQEVMGQTPARFHDADEIVTRAAELSSELGRPVSPGTEVFTAIPQLVGSHEVRQWTYIRKDGTRFPVELAVAPLFNVKNEPIGYVGIASDITQRCLAEEALSEARQTLERRVIERTAQLEAANRELALTDRHKSEFLAGMSHELRTPLNAILGFTGTLLMGLPGPLNEVQERQLRTVEKNAKHLLSLINDLLDLVKIESGKVELDLYPVSCQSVLEEIALTMRSLAENKGLEWRVSKPRVDLILRADRRALSQILLNLVSNAIKFTDRGSITIELLEREHDGATWAEWRVADTGIGIKSEDQAKLFHVFTQLDTRSTRRYEGTGLGLNLSQRLAVLLGGRITFTSAYGHGSTFMVTLPVTNEKS